MYDRKGRPKETVEFDKDGNIKKKTLYDKNGNPTEKIEYDKDGNV